jgi:beta-lactamase regulating signal transducer with metallopeptidase domain
MSANAVLAHLWSSTLVLLVAWLVARFAPRLTSRTRYAIVFAGLAKFALPSALFAPLARLIGRSGGGPSTIFMQLVGGPALAAPATRAAAATSLPSIAAAVWATIAIILLIRTVFVHRRAVVAALTDAIAGNEREHRALAAASRRAGLRQRVDVLRSPAACGPAVIGILRPRIVLPASADALDDGELEAILAHECAHVARRDNAAGAFETFLGALLWFHPIVIAARRELHRRREQACDEAAAEPSADLYVLALDKVCRASIAPRVAAVSCMASSQLKERVEHLMRLNDMKSRALSHRIVIAATVAAIALITIAIGAAGAIEPRDHGKLRYHLLFSLAPAANGEVTVNSRVVDTTDGHTLLAREIATTPGSHVRLREGTDDGRGRAYEITVDVDVSRDGSATGTLHVIENGVTIERSMTTTKLQTPAKHDPKFTGAAIDLRLQNAEPHDLFRVFGQLTGYTFVVDKEITTPIDISAHDIPWDQALDEICSTNRLDYKIDAATKTITITPRSR